MAASRWAKNKEKALHSSKSKAKKLITLTRMKKSFRGKAKAGRPTTRLVFKVKGLPGAYFVKFSHARKAANKQLR